MKILIVKCGVRNVVIAGYDPQSTVIFIESFEKILLYNMEKNNGL